MKVSFVATVFNEEENIKKLLDSVLCQTRLPDEAIIVDGGSRDKTVFKIKNYKSRIRGKFYLSLLIKKGNRSVGRNEAIKKAIGDIIVCSDAGCILDQDWVKNITAPFSDKKVDVVAGYYKGRSETIFQKCLVPYVLTMPDKINPDRFLPASRSIAFRKSIWEKIGGFPEALSDNEDYVFAKKLKKIGAEIRFEISAVAYWIPRKGLHDAFIMFYRFARGDMAAKILRPKVLLIFIRYLTGLLALFFAIIRSDILLFYILIFLFLIYLSYSIYKNFKYVKDIRAYMILPLLQIVSDVAVLTGTVHGLFRIWVTHETR